MAAGQGIHVSVDGGATFTDASENVPTDKWGGRESVSDIARVGDELIAVSNHAFLRSADHGKRWLRCSDPPPETDPRLNISEKRQAASAAGVAYTSIGSRLFVSTDAGRTWSQASGRIPMPFSDGMIATERGLYVYNTGNIGSLHRSTDHGATWKYILPALKLEQDEGFTLLAAVGGKLYATTMQGGWHTSVDGGDTWTRRWLGKGPDYQAPRPYRIWGLGGGELLFDMGLGLARFGKDEKIVPVQERKTLAAAVDGQNVYALNANYLSRSADGGRTFRDARVAGLSDDVVTKVSAFAKNIGIVASGPTAYFSFDGGATFQRGPEVDAVPQVVAVADGIYFSSKQGKRGVLFFQPAAGGPAREIGAGQDLGNAPPMILGVEGKTLFLFCWGEAGLVVSRDGGSTFTAAPKLDTRPTSYDPGLVRGDELIVAPNSNLYRSRAGAPFESLWKSTGPKKKPPYARTLVADGPLIHVVGENIFDWDPKTDQFTALGTKLPLDKEQREYVNLAAIQGKTILAQVRGNKRAALYVSRDHGGSYREVDGPEGYLAESFAVSDAGILVAGKGLWLLPKDAR